MIYKIDTATLSKSLPIYLYFFAINHHENKFSSDNYSLYKWIYCEKGHPRVELENATSILNPTQGLFIPKDSTYKLTSLSDELIVYSVGFDGPSCHEILTSLGMREAGVYTLSNPSIFKDYIKKMVAVYRKQDDDANVSYSKLCFNLLIDLSRNINRLNINLAIPDNPIITKIITYLDTHYSEDISLDKLAASIHISKEYACSVFKKYMHQTIIHHLTDLRLSHACIFLSQYPEKKISEISKMCGFESASYFGSVFKSMYGMTPEQYRTNKE